MTDRKFVFLAGGFLTLLILIFLPLRVKLEQSFSLGARIGSLPPTDDPPPITVRFYALPSDGSVAAPPAVENLCDNNAWQTARAVGTGNVSNTTDPISRLVGTGCGSTGTEVQRGFLAFDTSGLPTNAVVVSARLDLFVTAVANDINNGQDYLAVVEGRQQSALALSASDFPLAGGVLTNPPTGSDHRDLTEINPNTYLGFTLNNSGLSWVNRDGFTKLALREGHDLSGFWPNYNRGRRNNISIAASERPCTEFDPVLEVSYVIDSTDPTAIITIPSAGATVTGNVVVSAIASDNLGVAGVQFRLDGINLEVEDTSSPFSSSFDSRLFANGNHSLTAQVRDYTGNIGFSAPLTITIDNPQRPSVVVIMTDDQRWDTMEYMPLTNQVLGSNSVKFNNSFVTTPICCPSRASFLTGQYANHHNYYYPDDTLDYAATLPVWFQNLGYRTGLYGKYTEFYQLLAPFVPPGWNEWHALEHHAYYNYRLIENGVFSEFYGDGPEDYSTDVIFDQALDFIDSTPADQPFFLFITPFGPHGPAYPAPIDSGSFQSFPLWRPPSYNEEDVSDKPAWVQALNPLNDTQMGNSDVFHRNQLAALQSVDRGVERVVNTLATTGRLDNTIVIFTSDNGLSWGEHRWLDSKMCVYEECVRVPLWISVPGVSARQDDHLVLNVDLAPTITELVGFTPPTDIDGLSLVELLNNPTTDWRETILFEVGKHFLDDRSNFQAVRTESHLYTEYDNGDQELYDLQADPYQLNNIVTDPAQEETISSLQAQLNALRN